MNCAAIGKEMIESELFGHKKGVFTGATADKQGILEIADGGTVFLDEIAEMPPEIQAKLLRFLENKEIQKIGYTGKKPLTVDVRIIAATHNDRGSLRGDIFHRFPVYIDLP